MVYSLNRSWWETFQMSVGKWLTIEYLPWIADLMNVTLPYRAKIGPRSILSEEIYITFNASLCGETEDGRWRMEDRFCIMIESSGWHSRNLDDLDRGTEPIRRMAIGLVVIEPYACNLWYKLCLRERDRMTVNSFFETRKRPSTSVRTTDRGTGTDLEKEEPELIRGWDSKAAKSSVRTTDRGTGTDLGEE